MKISPKKRETSIETRVIRMKELIRITGLSRTTIWRWVNSGDLPIPIILGTSNIGWLAAEIYEWLKTRPRAKLKRSHNA